ncbi:MAG: hypothetical protein PHQ40_11575 [Anaerolineaceae bacterium]|nr:hypothetical protein [Anaerolineaceae bacterium]
MEEGFSDLVMNVISEILEYGGIPIPELTSAMCPLSDLPGFDSLNSLEADALLADQLGISIKPGELKWIESQQPSSISNIADQLSHLVQKKEKNE